MSAKTAKIFTFLMLMFLALYVGTGKTFEHHDYMITGFFIAFFALMGILPEGRSQKNDQGMGEESFRDFIALASGKLGSLEVARTCNVSIPTVARWALGTSSPGELAEPVIRKALEKKLASLPQDKQIAASGIAARMRWYADHAEKRPVNIELLKADCAEAADLLASHYKRIAVLEEAGGELAETLKLCKASLVAGLTKRELGFVMDALDKWNRAALNGDSHEG